MPEAKTSSLPLEVGSLPGALSAAEVRGFDPARDAASDTARAQLRAALEERGVVCLRFDRALADEELRAVAGVIGPIKDPVARGRDGALLRYADERQIIDSGFVLTEELRAQLGGLSFGGDAERPGLFEFFHTDDSYVAEPAAATVLHARELPSRGGATRFIDMRAAYELLERDERESLIGLRAIHAYNNCGAFPPRASASGPLEALPDVEHPIVRTHPVTGRRALYFDLDRAVSIVGLPEAEGRALLQRLQDHAEARAPGYAHAWRPHDVLVWDNAAVQHKASGDFSVGEPRRFWRYMVVGSRPY